ncbi:hypothetical protein OC834_000218 [Tilletia horrida]|nr:hypothetical protein OC834_000218 [Tilletia horrida]KAK0567875.1 hypothetical protein OC844_000076 [Tilletia horrida]
MQLKLATRLSLALVLISSSVVLAKPNPVPAADLVAHDAAVSNNNIFAVRDCTVCRICPHDSSRAAASVALRPDA